MTASSPARTPRARLAGAARLAWTLATFVVVQGAACGVAAAPSAWLWLGAIELTTGRPAWRVAAVSLLAVPSYALFALCLLFTSALAVRLCGWRTPPDGEMRLIDMGWPLLAWVRSMLATHLVRVLAGYLYRSSPIWTLYLRLAGARLGRRVYVNTLWLSDYNLLEFGDDVVIGGDVHLSGHTVEAGVVRTARVRLGSRVTVGLGSVVGIGVAVGDDCQVGAQSLVPKYARLEAGGVYAGTPARRLDTPDPPA
jgi:serine acetyltransferase